MTYCFRECTTTKGSLHGARFAPLILLTLLIVRFRIHPSWLPNSQFHEWALLCYDVYYGADSYGAPCHGFGRKRYYFSQFAKQMLPIVKPPSPPPPVPLRCPGFIFLTRLRQSPTLRYFAFVRAAERIFFTRIRAIMKSSCPCMPKYAREGKKRD